MWPGLQKERHSGAGKEREAEDPHRGKDWHREGTWFVQKAVRANHLPGFERTEAWRTWNTVLTVVDGEVMKGFHLRNNLIKCNFSGD